MALVGSDSQYDKVTPFSQWQLPRPNKASIAAAAAASFRAVNPLGTIPQIDETISNLVQGPDLSYDPYPDIPEDLMEFSTAFWTANSREDTLQIADALYRDIEDRRAMADHPTFSTFATLFFGLTDPVGWAIPASSIYKATRAMQAGKYVSVLALAGTTALDGAISIGASEVLLQAGLPSKTLGESAMDTLFGSLLTGLIGGGIGLYLNRRQKAFHQNEIRQAITYSDYVTGQADRNAPVIVDLGGRSNWEQKNVARPANFVVADIRQLPDYGGEHIQWAGIVDIPYRPDPKNKYAQWDDVIEVVNLAKQEDEYSSLAKQKLLPYGDMDVNNNMTTAVIESEPFLKLKKLIKEYDQMWESMPKTYPFPQKKLQKLTDNLIQQDVLKAQISREFDLPAFNENILVRNGSLEYFVPREIIENDLKMITMDHGLVEVGDTIEPNFIVKSNLEEQGLAIFDPQNPTKLEQEAIIPANILDDGMIVYDPSGKFHGDVVGALEDAGVEADRIIDSGFIKEGRYYSKELENINDPKDLEGIRGIQQEGEAPEQTLSKPQGSQETSEADRILQTQEELNRPDLIGDTNEIFYDDMDYRTLQKLAKEKGIKANQKKTELVTQLKNKEGIQPEETIPSNIDDPAHIDIYKSLPTREQQEIYQEIVDYPIADMYKLSDYFNIPHNPSVSDQNFVRELTGKIKHTIDPSEVYLPNKLTERIQNYIQAGSKGEVSPLFSKETFENYNIKDYLLQLDKNMIDKYYEYFNEKYWSEENKKRYGITEEIFNSIDDYKGLSYVEINDYLRDLEINDNLIEQTQSDIKNINKIFDQMPPIENDLILFRAQGHRELFDKIYKQKMDLRGKTIQNEAFLSTTIDQQIAARFLPSNSSSEKPIYMEIEVPKGSKGFIHAFNVAEKEYLGHFDNQYEIVDHAIIPAGNVPQHLNFNLSGYINESDYVYLKLLLKGGFHGQK